MQEEKENKKNDQISVMSALYQSDIQLPLLMQKVFFLRQELTFWKRLSIVLLIVCLVLGFYSIYLKFFYYYQQEKQDLNSSE